MESDEETKTDYEYLETIRQAISDLAKLPPSSVRTLDQKITFEGKIFHITSFIDRIT